MERLAKNRLQNEGEGVGKGEGADEGQGEGGGVASCEFSAAAGLLQGAAECYGIPPASDAGDAAAAAAVDGGGCGDDGGGGGTGPAEKVNLLAFFSEEGEEEGAVEGTSGANAAAAAADGSGEVGPATAAAERDPSQSWPLMRRVLLRRLAAVARAQGRYMDAREHLMELLHLHVALEEQQAHSRMNRGGSGRGGGGDGRDGDAGRRTEWGAAWGADENAGWRGSGGRLGSPLMSPQPSRESEYLAREGSGGSGGGNGGGSGGGNGGGSGGGSDDVFLSASPPPSGIVDPSTLTIGGDEDGSGGFGADGSNGGGGRGGGVRGDDYDSRDNRGPLSTSSTSSRLSLFISDARRRMSTTTSSGSGLSRFLSSSRDLYDSSDGINSRTAATLTDADGGASAGAGESAGRTEQAAVMGELADLAGIIGPTTAPTAADAAAVSVAAVPVTHPPPPVLLSLRPLRASTEVQPRSFIWTPPAVVTAAAAGGPPGGGTGTPSSVMGGTGTGGGGGGSAGAADTPASLASPLFFDPFTARREREQRERAAARDKRVRWQLGTPATIVASLTNVLSVPLALSCVRVVLDCEPSAYQSEELDIVLPPLCSGIEVCFQVTPYVLSAAVSIQGLSLEVCGVQQCVCVDADGLSTAPAPHVYMFQEQGQFDASARGLVVVTSASALAAAAAASASSSSSSSVSGSTSTDRDREDRAPITPGPSAPMAMGGGGHTPLSPGPARAAALSPMRAGVYSPPAQRLVGHASAHLPSPSMYSRRMPLSELRSDDVSAAGGGGRGADAHHAGENADVACVADEGGGAGGGTGTGTGVGMGVMHVCEETSAAAVEAWAPALGVDIIGIGGGSRLTVDLLESETRAMTLQLTNATDRPVVDWRLWVAEVARPQTSVTGEGGCGSSSCRPKTDIRLAVDFCGEYRHGGGGEGVHAGGTKDKGAVRAVGEASAVETVGGPMGRCLEPGTSAMVPFSLTGVRAVSAVQFIVDCVAADGVITSTSGVSGMNGVSGVAVSPTLAALVPPSPGTPSTPGGDDGEGDDTLSPLPLPHVRMGAGAAAGVTAGSTIVNFRRSFAQVSLSTRDVLLVDQLMVLPAPASAFFRAWEATRLEALLGGAVFSPVPLQKAALMLTNAADVPVRVYQHQHREEKEQGQTSVTLDARAKGGLLVALPSGGGLPGGLSWTTSAFGKSRAGAVVLPSDLIPDTSLLSNKAAATQDAAARGPKLPVHVTICGSSVSLGEPLSDGRARVELGVDTFYPIVISATTPSNLPTVPGSEDCTFSPGHFEVRAHFLPAHFCGGREEGGDGQGQGQSSEGGGVVVDGVLGFSVPVSAGAGAGAAAQQVGAFQVCCTRTGSVTLVVAARYVAAACHDDGDGCDDEAGNEAGAGTWWVHSAPLTLHAVSKLDMSAFEKVEIE